MFKFVFSMSNETTDDCEQVPYETVCLVENCPGLNKDYEYYHFFRRHWKGQYKLINEKVLI